MKAKMQIKKRPKLEHFHFADYSSTAETKVYKPLSDKKGIHCEGDKFGYIVDWQVEINKKHNTPQ